METEVCFWLDTDDLNRYEFEFQNTDKMLLERFPKPLTVLCSGERRLLDLSSWRGVYYSLYWADDCREPSLVVLHAIVVRGREIGVLSQSEVPILNSASEPQFEIIGLDDAFRWFECHEPTIASRGSDYLNSILFPPPIVAGAVDPLPPGDGLYDDEKVIVWGGVRYDLLTKKMIDILSVLVEQYQKGFPVVSLDLIREQSGYPFYGSFKAQAFKQKRKGEPTIHPVADIIEPAGSGSYRLIDPKK
ncbi:MAG TPA: hypothetical protein PKD64_11470 [Pirellulaceae bacterium]|nr:hypothetical protein [Pirellulaceae bacterium]HMO92802.1 hypothetical protein [Pirellulaceae bacterium]HMP69384.1 hypothetical protein [Pirellulaceae bacterium]